MITSERHAGHRGRPVRTGLRAVTVAVAAATVTMPAAVAASTSQAHLGTAAGGGIISTVAGGVGPPGPATAVGLPGPCGLAVATGHLFIAEYTALFRKVSSTGFLTTPAGTGDAGPFADGGPATATSVGGCGVAVDHSGNLVVTDAEHNRIRVVPATTGTFYRQHMTAAHIYTVAGDGTGGSAGDGGPALAAELNSPEAIRVDTDGNLLISDTSGGRVRVVAERTGTFYGQHMTTGDIYTVAGGGSDPGDGVPATSAGLPTPQGLAVDAAGNLLIADNGTNRVRVVAEHTGVFYGQHMTTGDIYTVAGNGQAGFAGDGGPATSAKLAFPDDVAPDHAGNLVIADSFNNRVRVVAVSTGTFYGRHMIAGDIYTVSGNGTAAFAGDGGPAAAAELNNPGAVKVDGTGNLVIADTSNSRVRVVAAGTGTFYGRHMIAGDIYTVAGNGTQGYSGDGHPAVSAQLWYPQAVAVDPAGDVMIADTDNERVRVVAARTGSLYGQAMTAGRIYTVAGTGAFAYSGDGGPATKAALTLPYGVALDGAGNLLIADTENERVRVVAARTGRFYGKAMTTGDIYTVAGTGVGAYSGDGGPATKADLWFPAGVGLDAAGNVLIADADNSRIRVVAVKTGTFYGQAMTAGDIYSIAGGNGSGYFGDGGPATKAGLSGPFAVTVDRAGNVVISDTGNNAIRVVAVKTGTFYGKAMTAGDIYTVAGDGYAGYRGDGGPATKAHVSSPGQVAVDAAGNLVIAASSDGRIRVVAVKTGMFYGQAMTAGDIYTVAGGGPFGFSGDGGPATKASLVTPWGVALDGAGGLVVADTGNHRIREVSG
jgi:hypothetical protein